MKRGLLLVLLFLPLLVLAQEEKIHEFPRLRWGIDVGTDMFDGKTVKNPNIRESQSYYYDYPFYIDDRFYGGFLFNSYNYTRYYIGIKPEYSLNHRVTVAAGLRFSFNKSELNSDQKYFLWKVSEENLTTNYVQVSGVNQNNFYVGVPLEVKFFPAQSDMLVRQYFKMGMLFNFLAASQNSVSFIDENMKKYGDIVSKQMGKPSFFTGYLYFGIGFNIARMNHPFGSIEIQAPVRVFNNKKLASFIQEPAEGFGLQATFYIPTGKKKLSYTYY